MLEIVVHEVRGYCPVYKVGDKIVIDDPEIVLEKTDVLCTQTFKKSLIKNTFLLTFEKRFENKYVRNSSA